MSAMKGKSVLFYFLFFYPVSVAAVRTDVCDVCLPAGPEEDDIQVTDENHHQHAKPLPLPVCQSPAGMDSFSLQYALLHRFYGTGIDFCVSACGYHTRGLNSIHLKKLPNQCFSS